MTRLYLLRLQLATISLRIDVSTPARLGPVVFSKRPYNENETVRTRKAKRQKNIYHLALPTTSNMPGLCVLILPRETCLYKAYSYIKTN
jgi:hypothetical protein